MILCPSLNHVTCGLGQLAMGGRSSTMAWPREMVLFCAGPMKSPISVEKRQRRKVRPGWGTGRVLTLNMVLLLEPGTKWCEGLTRPGQAGHLPGSILKSDHSSAPGLG